jgi:hypothetical protein
MPQRPAALPELIRFGWHIAVAPTEWVLERYVRAFSYVVTGGQATRKPVPQFRRCTG